MSRDERGAVLVAVVLITLALFAIGHGLLQLSLGELAASRAAVRLFESNAAAESAVHLTIAAPGPAWMDSVAIGTARTALSRSFGRAQVTVMAWRLSREAWWVEGAARVGSTESRTSRLAWAMDPAARVLALPGAVSVGLGSPVTLAGSVDVTVPEASDPPLDPTDCDAWLAELAAHYALDPLPATATIVADTLPSLGRLDFADLVDAATVSVAGFVSPAPVEAAGLCTVAEPTNWGDPERPWRSCGGHLPLRRSLGSLVVAGGTGQGVLVVDGDLVLDAGAHVYGLALVSGALRVEGGAQLVGMAVATGGVEVASDGIVRASACWATRALAAHRGDLGRLRVMSGQGAIGPI